MDTPSIVVVYHPNCKASTDFLIQVNKLRHAEIEYINIKEDKIETEIKVDTVPLIILNNDPSEIYEGRAAFDKINDLITKPQVNPTKKESRGVKYSKGVTFIEQSDKKEKIDLSKR